MKLASCTVLGTGEEPSVAQGGTISMSRANRDSIAEP